MAHINMAEHRAKEVEKAVALLHGLTAPRATRHAELPLGEHTLTTNCLLGFDMQAICLAHGSRSCPRNSLGKREVMLPPGCDDDTPGRGDGYFSGQGDGSSRGLGWSLLRAIRPRRVRFRRHTHWIAHATDAFSHTHAARALGQYRPVNYLPNARARTSTCLLYRPATGTEAMPKNEITHAAGLAFTFTKKGGVLLSYEQGSGFVIAKVFSLGRGGPGGSTLQTWGLGRPWASYVALGQAAAAVCRRPHPHTTCTPPACHPQERPPFAHPAGCVCCATVCAFIPHFTYPPSNDTRPESPCAFGSWRLTTTRW